MTNINFLLRTDVFTGMERNNKGQTPIGVYSRNHQISHTLIRSKLMEIFNLHTEEELEEALRIVPTEGNRKHRFFFYNHRIEYHLIRPI